MTNSGDQLAPIEQALREEADRLLRLCGNQPRTSALLAAHRRRVRHARIARTACSVAAVMLLVGGSVVWRGSWTTRSVAERAPAVPEGTTFAPISPNTAASPTHLSETPAQAPRLPGRVEPWGPVNADESMLRGVPVLITVLAGGKQEVIAVGFYVPEHTEQVSLLDLSPAEQYAVRQVLGLDEARISHDCI